MEFKEMAKLVVTSGMGLHEAQKLFTEAVIHQAIEEAGSECGAATTLNVHRNTIHRNQAATERKQPMKASLWFARKSLVQIG